MRDFFDTFGADAPPTQYVAQKRADVGRSERPAERYEEHRVERKGHPLEIMS